MEEKEISKSQRTVDLLGVLLRDLESTLGKKLSKEYEELCVDIVDINESAVEVTKWTGDLRSALKDQNKEEAAKSLIELKTEYDHILWHYRHGKALIDKLADELYGE